LRRTAHRLSNKRGGHRRGDADLGLAAALSSRERRVVLAEVADRDTGQQSLANLVHRQLALALDERIDDRRHDAGRAAGRRGDDEVTASVFLRRRQGAGGNERNGAVALILFIL